ncbi:hypothetical protein [Synechococcus sp. MIT S9452]|uniref:hypothetical protein n=1 Tax=Synechococcus sp. MIT S9452 TaxID=3082546 RepID=UPI0039A4F53E
MQLLLAWGGALVGAALLRWGGAHLELPSPGLPLLLSLVFLPPLAMGVWIAWRSASDNPVD